MTYDASMANTTAMASGANRDPATPDRKKMGTNTMQIANVDTNVGHGDLPRPFEDGVFDVAAPLMLEHAVDILDADRGVIHQHTNRQRQPAQGHHVECLAKCAQRDDRTQDRQRNRQRHDQRRTPTAEKQQDHRGREIAGDERLNQHPIECGFHEERLVRQNVDTQRRRQGRQHARQRCVGSGSRRRWWTRRPT